MPKRVAVILSGCGVGDGSDLHESLLTLLSIERGGAQAVCAAPDLASAGVWDHLANQRATDAAPRRALVEAARLARGRIRELSTLQLGDFDALIVPGGAGVGDVLSNYAARAQLCEVHPHLAQLLKAALSSHRPMGFVGLAALLAARVLGPVAGVRLTLGPRTGNASKDAAVMGADVRPSAITDIFLDKKTRIISTGGFLHDEMQLTQAGQAIDKLVRTVLHLARDRTRPPAPPPPGPNPPGGRPAQAPRPPGPQSSPATQPPAVPPSPARVTPRRRTI
jgi:enhancing lycopene biosynthesis protein 2